MFDIKAFDRQVGDRAMDTWGAYAFCMAVFAALGVVFTAWCYQVTSDWDVATTDWWILGVWVLVAGAAMWVGLKRLVASGSLLMYGLGFMLIAGSFGLVLGAVMSMFDVGDMMRVFALSAMIAGVMCVVNWLGRSTMISWILGLVALVAMGYWSGTVLAWAWIAWLLDHTGMSASGSMTMFDWVCWVVLGLSVVCASIRGMKQRHTFGNAVVAGGGVFVDPPQMVLARMS